MDASEAVFLFEWIRARGTKDGSSASKDASDRLNVEWHGDVFKRTTPSVAKPNEFMPISGHPLSHNRPNDRVEAGTISTTGENAYLHWDLLVTFAIALSCICFDLLGTSRIHIDVLLSA